MDFQSERSAITLLSDTIVNSAVSLYNAIKYIYSLAEDDFYNCNIKDVIKVILNNLTDTNCLQAMGLRINNQKCREMNTPEYDKVLSLLIYSFAVRIPILKNVVIKEQSLTDEQLKAIYTAVMEKGGNNFLNTIHEDYEGYKKLVKSGKPVHSYKSEWYKRYIKNVPGLATISNKNMFLIGTVEVLFSMFYTCLEEELSQIIFGLEKL